MRQSEPIQLDQRILPNCRTPEQRLMAALLIDAIAIARRCDNLSYERARKRDGLRNEAVEWIKDRRATDLLSFSFTCELLGLDPGRVRAIALGSTGKKRTNRHYAKGRRT